MGEKKPHLCMVFEATGPYNAIGRIAMAEVEAALSADWRVSVVAHRLDESLQDRVEWLKLYNPPRGFAVKWLSARYFIKKAMGDPGRFDLIHGHQPQVADLCDIFECHYLTRAAWERGCRDARKGLRGYLARLQEDVVLKAEDRCYGKWDSSTTLVCNSKLTQDVFGELYGLPPSHEIQLPPAPAWNLPSSSERAAARKRFGVEWDGPVVGFLGGIDERKGCLAALEAVGDAPELFLLLGGSHGEQVNPPIGRYAGHGLIDANELYASVDVLFVPSVFEPFGLVCFEAAARGVPVIMTGSVGALNELERFGCGKHWEPGQALGPLVEALMVEKPTVSMSCRRLVEWHSDEHFAEGVMKRYRTVLQQGSSQVLKTQSLVISDS